MMRRAVTLVGAAALVFAAISAVFLIGMRRKSPVVLDTVRRVNREVFNPRQMESAGTPGAYASVVQHRGRTSGIHYETPVDAVATEDGFVIALPYGDRSDWLKNVLAVGSATIVDEGSTSPVDRPEVIPLESALHWFPEKAQRSLHLFGTEQCLRVRTAEGAPATEAATDTQPSDEPDPTPAV